jgi:hypothetical protein
VAGEVPAPDCLVPDGYGRAATTKTASSTRLAGHGFACSRIQYTGSPSHGIRSRARPWTFAGGTPPKPNTSEDQIAGLAFDQKLIDVHTPVAASVDHTHEILSSTPNEVTEAVVVNGWVSTAKSCFGAGPGVRSHVRPGG